MTTTTRKISKSIAKALTFGPLLVFLGYATSAIVLHPAFIIPAFFYFKFVFKFQHDQLYVYGRVYAILKKDTRLIHVGVGTMHQTSSPWNKGTGIYIVAFKRCLQIGLCKPQHLSEESGILSAMQGRYLDLTPHEIGNWNAVPKGNKTGAPTG
jgi:hypothetical protein